jgi:hypothetical protein
MANGKDPKTTGEHISSPLWPYILASKEILRHLTDESCRNHSKI